MSIVKAFYSSRPGSTWDFTHVRLIFMNDSFIKCVSSILKYWRNVLITEENEWINQPHSIVHPGLYCRCLGIVLSHRNCIITDWLRLKPTSIHQLKLNSLRVWKLKDEVTSEYVGVGIDPFSCLLHANSIISRYTQGDYVIKVFHFFMPFHINKVNY